MSGSQPHTHHDSKMWDPFVRLPGNPYLVEGGLKGFRIAFVHLFTGTSGGDYPLVFGSFASLVRMNGGAATILLHEIAEVQLPEFSQFDLAVFYPMTTTLTHLIEVCSIIKQNCNISICLVNSEQHQHEMLLCSPHAEAFARELMIACSAIDHVLLGEAEFAFISLCNTLFHGGDNYKIPAHLFRENGQLVRSSLPIRPVEFKFLPFPSRDFLQETRTSSGGNTVSPRVQSSRGCVSRCLFCAESQVNIHPEGRRTPWLGRDIVSFVDEIELLAKDYGIFFFNVIDSSFEDPGDIGIARMHVFCDEIERRAIKASFKLHLRVPTLGELDDLFLKRFKEIGVDIIVTGIESGLDDELAAYCSKTDAAANARVLAQIDRRDLFFTLLGHMMFSPFLRLEDLYMKCAFLRSIRRGWDYLNVSNNVLVYRGTALHEKIVSTGLMEPFDSLATLVPYRFLDERVGQVANAVGAIKSFYPVMELNNLAYNALNIVSRSRNPMNCNVAREADLIKNFRTQVDAILSSMEVAYLDCFFELCDLARSGWNEREVRPVIDRFLIPLLPQAHSRLRDSIASLLAELHHRVVDTDRLVLKTWLSELNERNTSSGSL